MDCVRSLQTYPVLTSRVSSEIKIKFLYLFYIYNFSGFLSGNADALLSDTESYCLLQTCAETDR